MVGLVRVCMPLFFCSLLDLKYHSASVSGQWMSQACEGAKAVSALHPYSRELITAKICNPTMRFRFALSIPLHYYRTQQVPISCRSAVCAADVL